MSIFSEIARQTFDLLLPKSCLACGRVVESGGPDLFCPRCYESIKYVRPPVCNTCGIAVAGDETRAFRCGICHNTTQQYDLARSLVYYSGPVKKVVARIKYHEDQAAVKGVQAIVENSDLSLFQDCDLIIPVPLHIKRLRSRGLNQSLELARCFFPLRRSDIEPNLLVKIRNTPVQTSLDGRSRRRNLRNSFVVKHAHKITGKSICLVDDVLTTGTTISECSRVLKFYGAAKVKALTLARTSMR